jgi:carboxyl-terminal processing protease
MKTLSRSLPLALLLLCSSFLHTQEAPITSMQRGFIGVMLNEIKDDVKRNYYDPKYHGVDLDARFKQAAEYVKTSTTYNQAISIVAWSLKPLNDSHTYLIPPTRPVKVSYSYDLQIIGNKCYATAIEPGGEAEKSGLKVGDRILSMNGIGLDRATFWEANYLYRILRPQTADQIVVEGANALPRTLNIAARVTARPHHLHLGIEDFDQTREAQTRRKKFAPRSHELGNAAIIWKLPSFSQDERVVDEMIRQTARFPALILDLREDGGGSEAVLLRFLASLFDHEVKVGDRITRKGVEPLVAKAQGGKPYPGKVIVLVDERSASASEIFARVLQLQNRGTVIGDQTAGSVMEAMLFRHPFGRSDDEIYGTMISHADIQMTDGKSLERVGVMPDEELLPTAEELANNRDPVLARAARLVGAELSAEDAGKLFPIEWSKD